MGPEIILGKWTGGRQHSRRKAQSFNGARDNSREMGRVVSEPLLAQHHASMGPEIILGKWAYDRRRRAHGPGASMGPEIILGKWAGPRPRGAHRGPCFNGARDNSREMGPD